MNDLKPGDIIIFEDCTALQEINNIREGSKGVVLDFLNNGYIVRTEQNRVCFAEPNQLKLFLRKDKSGNNINKENNMKILEIYEERKEKILYMNYKEKIKEIESFDSIQCLINDAQDQLNTLLGRKDDDKVTISVNNLKGDKLHDEITQVKIEEAGLNYDKQKFELNSLIEEVQALLEMTSDYNEQIKILKKYDILNKEGKLNV